MAEISEAAKAKARQLLAAQFIEGEGGLADFIQQVSDAAKAVLCGLGEPKRYHEAHLAPFILPEPVDPLLIEAREIIIRRYQKIRDHDYAVWVSQGKKDDTSDVQIALAGLKRGMTLAKEGAS